jgi:UDP-N-acetylglucosamine--N-acetylmuramyl-(pentapeptide) pyrophosphoryl-undecaprenol N-acetylglucosamine transferase
MSAAPLIVFAGGGTGGHLFPPLAVVSALRDLVHEVRVLFFGTNRPIDRTILDGTGCDFVPQSVQPIRVAKPWTWPGFLNAWYASRRACRDILARERPAAVVGNGGFASGPAVAEARRAGIATALLNPDVIPGRANRYLASRADVVFVQWEESTAHFPGHPGVKITGCPIRADFLNATRAGGIKRFELDPARKTLLVTGASQGARTINDAMLELLDDLEAATEWQILHVTGTADAERVRDAYRGRKLTGTVTAFTEHMADALAASDLVIARAGASSLAEITALGRPALLMPYPHHRDQHQRANADVLARRGAARLVPDQNDCRENAAALRQELVHLLRDEGELARMSNAARRLGRKDAANVIAGELLRLGRRASTTSDLGT